MGTKNLGTLPIVSNGHCGLSPERLPQDGIPKQSMQNITRADANDEIERPSEMPIQLAHGLSTIGIADSDINEDSDTLL
jgi:hypothetical protein